MKKLAGLMVMQNGIRDFKQMPAMIEFVRNGGIWTKDALNLFSNHVHNKLINIPSFPDGLEAIHDGHHRAVATVLAGRDFLYDEEYNSYAWDYPDYTEPSFEHGWVTPHDPRTHVRTADFWPFKDKVLKLATTDLRAAREYIEKNKHLYLVPRTIYYLPELVELYKNGIV
jgi:hypothetical protein